MNNFNVEFTTNFKNVINFAYAAICDRNASNVNFTFNKNKLFVVAEGKYFTEKLETEISTTNDNDKEIIFNRGVDKLVKLLYAHESENAEITFSDDYITVVINNKTYSIKCSSEEDELLGGNISINKDLTMTKEQFDSYKSHFLLTKNNITSSRPETVNTISFGYIDGTSTILERTVGCQVNYFANVNGTIYSPEQLDQKYNHKTFLSFMPQELYDVVNAISTGPIDMEVRESIIVLSSENIRAYVYNNFKYGVNMFITRGKQFLADSVESNTILPIDDILSGTEDINGEYLVHVVNNQDKEILDSNELSVEFTIKNSAISIAAEITTDIAALRAIKEFGVKEFKVMADVDNSQLIGFDNNKNMVVLVNRTF